MHEPRGGSAYGLPLLALALVLARRKRLCRAVGLALFAACDGEGSGTDASAPPARLSPSDAGSEALRIGDACKDRALPVRPIDAGRSDADEYVLPSTPVCLVTKDAPQGYFSWTCEGDRDCPSGAYCDNAVADESHEQAFCRVECASDAECSGQLCCGESTPLTCVAEEGVRGCRCEANCMPVYPFDGGAVRYAPSTCGGCQFWCCGEECLNLANDARNCGACGHVCEGDFPYCDNGKCSPPPCSSPADAQCDRCCDLVYSVEGGERVTVPVLRTNRTSVSPRHALVRVTFVSGRSIAMSPGHPTGEGQTFADLGPGDRLGQVEIQAVQTVSFGLPFTVDILPATTTGTYFAAGALVGSTLAPSDR